MNRFKDFLYIIISMKMLKVLGSIIFIYGGWILMNRFFHYVGCGKALEIVLTLFSFPLIVYWWWRIIDRFNI